MHTQHDSRGKIDILGGDNIGHCEKKKKGPYEHVSNSEWLAGQSCWKLKYKSIVSGSK